MAKKAAGEGLSGDDLDRAIEGAREVLAGLEARKRELDHEAVIAGEREYRGSENVAALVRYYMDKGAITQTELARRVGRSQGAVSKLCRGHDDKRPWEPYFGEREDRSPGGDKTPLLDRVKMELRIPQGLLDDALDLDRMAWAVEQVRRKRAASRDRSRGLTPQDD